MRRLGLALLWLGAAVGAAMGLALLTGIHPADWSWIIAVGFAKLATVSSLGLMAGGAVCLRLDRRDQQRALMSADSEPTDHER